MRGDPRGYLAAEASFAIVKALQTRNLVVPVVGDFAGPKAVRAVGAYLKRHGATVSAFYVSNVEQYLRLERVWGSFCGNAARLPIDEASTFIRAGPRRPLFAGHGVDGGAGAHRCSKSKGATARP